LTAIASLPVLEELRASTNNFDGFANLNWNPATFRVLYVSFVFQTLMVFSLADDI
jgi:hypothetical protein